MAEESALHVQLSEEISEDEETGTELNGPPLMPPAPPYQATEWTDITSDFFGAVKDLALGELVHHPIFGLFEAMSAIEMMDPKMDAGMCCNKNTAKPLTFETAVTSNQLKLADLSNSELIGIFDSLLACLVSWLEGHSATQTLFTCLYLHKPHDILDRPLRAYCLAIRKLIQKMRNFINTAMVYEEEDYEQRDYEFDLQTKLTYGKCCLQLKEAEEQLLRRAKSGGEDDGGATATVSDETQAVASRLRFMRLLLEALVAIWPDEQLSPNELEMVEIQKLLAGALDAIPTMRRTIAMGTQPIEDADEPNPMGFSPLVNQRLLAPTFPRFTKIKDRDDSLAFLEEMVQRIRTTGKVIKCQNFHSALNFFMDFSKNARPCLLSRSVLQVLYFPRPNLRYGTTSMSDALRESVRSFISPPVLTARHPLAANQRAVDCADAFFAHNVNTQAFISFVQICGFNKARQRDKLARLLNEFAAVGDDAERVDAYLQSLYAKDSEPHPYFCTWVLYHSLRAMSMYLLSGLELELYAVHEYIYIFWYLSQFLSNWIVTTLSRAELLAEQSRNVAAGLAANAKPKKPNKAQTSKRRLQNPYYREVVYNQALSNMFGGYFKALVAFTLEQRIPQPLSIFDNELVRFDHRFAPFAGITTLPPVPYEEFSGAREYLMTKPAEQLYDDAAKHFQRARFILETITGGPDQEIADIIRVAKVNFVVMNLLANGHKKDSRSAPVFDFSTHKFFPIIKQQ